MILNYIKKFFNKYVLVIIFIAVWEISSRLNIVSPIFLPPFTKVMEVIIKMIKTGEFIVNFRISMFRAMSGFIIASLIGIPLGLLLGGWFKKIKLALDLLLEVCSQVNPFLMFHVIVLFLGIGEFSKISIIVWTCVWPIIFSTINGIANVNPELLKTGRTFGLGRVSLFLKIVLPATAPKVFNGLRLAAGYSLLMLTAAEMMGSKSGLGYLIINSQENFRITEMYAAVLIIALVALVVDYIMEVIEKKFVVFEDEGIMNGTY